MKELLRVVYEGGEGEIVEKKSRFIATVRPVESEEDATQFIEEMKKKYWDARHNCYAYVVGNNMELQRFSDDGEPSGTAGKPMLDILLAQEIHNAAVVVTRYFGGTLLGTGGLVRAYGGAVKEGLANSVVIEKTYGTLLEIRTDYTGLGKIQYQLAQKGIDILDCIYAEDVCVQAPVPVSRIEEIEKCITQVTGGKGRMQRIRELYFAKKDGQVLTFQNLPEMH